MALALTAFAVAGCGNGGPPPEGSLHTIVTQPPWETKQSTLFSGNGSLFGTPARGGPGGGDTQGIGVNAYLWRGALDTLAFMPLLSADPFGGVIITDWWTPPTGSNERFKATAYILGRQLRADGIRISVFRQVEQGSNWVDAPIDPGTATDLENKVLAKARELRAQSASSQ